MSRCERIPLRASQSRLDGTAGARRLRSGTTALHSQRVSLRDGSAQASHVEERPSAPPQSGRVVRQLTLDAVPRLAVSPHALRELPLDHNAGFLVWLVDGSSTIETILDACPIRRDHALAILRVLAAHGVIEVD